MIDADNSGINTKVDNLNDAQNRERDYNNHNQEIPKHECPTELCKVSDPCNRRHHKNQTKPIELDAVLTTDR